MNNESPLLASLNVDQKAVVLYNTGPSLVIAGPGSGKTRALTHKITYIIKELGMRSNQVLAVTFTNKAAKEMKDRVIDLLKLYTKEYNMLEGDRLPWISTFHSVCARILRTEAPRADLGKNFVIYDTDDSVRLLKGILLDMDISPKEFSPKNILSTIYKAKNDLVTSRQFEAQAMGYYFERVAKIYPVYQKLLRENNALDFSDLLFETVMLFDKTPSLLEFYQDKFKYILIDEYQDTNRVQYYLAKQLAAKHRKLTVVGDISQSIYSWRGADYKNMVQFESDYPDAVVFKLSRNYRSTENILRAAVNLIQNNSTHIPIDLYTRSGIGAKIKLFEAENERSEAQYVVDSIALGFKTGIYEAYVKDSADYNKFAVLYRTNAQSRVIEEAFMREGIPYRIIGGVRFYDRKEIRDALSYLRVFLNPKDSISWLRCINTPSRGIGAKTLMKVKESRFDLELIKQLTGLSWEKYIKLVDSNKVKPIELLDTVLNEFGYLEYLDDGTDENLSRIENLKELRTVANQFESLSEFLENVSLVESSNRVDESDSNVVTLMTMHAAKGLEFNTVFMVGMEEGIFPHAKSMTSLEELEEERRLCYVGITRAKEQLHLAYARNRTYFGQSGATVISRFISEIPEDVINFRFG